MAHPEYQPRTLSATLRRAAGGFPAVVVTGPRQSGKTTLVRHLFGASHAYCSLDDPAVRAQAASDPGLLLARYAPPVILDEIQYVPDLLHAVKSDVDRHRRHGARYVITGSQLFPLMQGVGESLAGRAAVTSLLSMSMREAAGHPDKDRSWQQALLASPPQREEPMDPRSLLTSLYRGGYPDPALRPEIDPGLWHASYVQTYLERDVRTLRAVGDLAEFQRLLFTLAARSSGLINFEELARDVGTTGKTIRAWLTILESSGQVHTLRPYHANIGKRLVKRPKVYFLDTGTLSYLLGVRSPDDLFSGMHAGPIFESAVLGQLLRLFVHRGEVPRIYFWRTAAGHEVDFVLDDGSTLTPVEARLTTRPTSQDAAGITEFQRLLGRRAGRGLLVCSCHERHALTATVDAVPLGAF